MQLDLPARDVMREQPKTICLASLIEAIKNSTRSVDVCVPSQDYYREPGEWERETIRYIDPFALIEELDQMK